MKTYETFARDLDRLLGSNQAVRINVSGYMPLSIEAIGRSAKGGTLVALSHTAVQNGDLMRDPEIVFEIRTVLGVRTADCVPVLLHSTGAVAAIHAGWRGTLEGVVRNAVEALMEEINIFLEFDNGSNYVEPIPPSTISATVYLEGFGPGGGTTGVELMLQRSFGGSMVIFDAVPTGWVSIGDPETGWTLGGPCAMPDGDGRVAVGRFTPGPIGNNQGQLGLAGLRGEQLEEIIIIVDVETNKDA